ncbi:zinc-binding dehydrogenase [Marinomonas mediterranea]|nr:zinc-binding dehydrogenase [Marinomonas mediterranea]
MMSYKAITLKKRPETVISEDLFDVVELNQPDLLDGQVLVKLSHLSLDPAMRGWMSPDENSYIPPVKLGDVMRASGVGDIVESKNEQFPVGTRVMGLMGLTEYAVNDGSNMNIVPKEIPQEAILSVVALPGVTAYHGLFEVLKPQKGQTIAITAAAGSVGSLVGQMAKNLGLTVIGVAGTNEKCQWLTEELGFDHALNYKADDFQNQLTNASSNGIDLFFENTGGTAQAPIFNAMNAHGRIAVCGLIAEYNKTEASAGPNWVGIIKKRLNIQGFTMPDHFHKFPEYGKALGQMLMKGELKYRAHTLEGINSATSGINLLFSGENKGKLIVKL